MLPASSVPPNMDRTPASRESSEFEFVGNNGGNGTSNTAGGAAPVSAILPAVVEAASTGPPSERERAASSSDESDFPLFGWVKGSSLLSKVAEKTKSSMETVITTLDPQMKDYIRSSGSDVCVVVASDKEVKVKAVKEAFQKVLGRTTVFGMATKGATIAEQPVGFAAGRQAAQERLQAVRQKHTEGGVIAVAVENFIFEVGNDEWVDIGCVVLHDEARKIHLTSYTQPTPIASKFVAILKDATPDTYPKRWSGFARSVGEVVEECQVASHKDWHSVLGGIPRSELIRMAAESLAHVYNKSVATKVDNV